ncbi:MAG: hypothetical protein ACYS0I_11510 [Planctomycetota bacterium]|jgi:photosystem II stability/assembly factor-like uncharacterized protein
MTNNDTRKTIMLFSRSSAFDETASVALLSAVILFLFMLPTAVFSTSWESIGPSGGNFIGSVTSPTDANQITTITTNPSPTNVYRSVNGGASWSNFGEIPTSYLNDMCAFDFSKLYALTGYGCYRSTDGGANWSYSSFPGSSGYAYCICVDPTDSNNVYAAGYKFNSDTDTYSLAFFKSTDGGQGWSDSSFFSFYSFYPYDMAISQTDPNVIYVAGYKWVNAESYYGALLKTSDGGTTWTDISSSVETLSWTFFYSVAIDPTDENRVYVGGNYFYRSTDGGTSWTRGATYLYALAIGINPADTSNIYVASSDDVHISTNYGQSWTLHYDCTKGAGAHIEIAQDFPSTIYISTLYGFYRSMDSGNTWNPAHEGIYTTRIPALAVAPSQPRTVLIEYDGCGVMGSYNSGDNWNFLGYFVACGNVCDILINPSDPNTILALEGAG